MKIFNIRNLPLALILILVYFYESYEMFVDSSSSSYYNLVVSAMFGICTMVCLLGEKKPSQPFIKSASALILLMYLMTIINIDSNAFPAQIFYLTLLMSLPVMHASKILFRRCENVQSLGLVLSLFLLLSLYYFLNYQSNILQDIMSQNMSSYALLYFVPFILCVNKNWLKIIGLLIVFVALITSLKRGGIVAFVISLIAYFMFEMARNKVSNKGQFRFILTAIAIVCGLFYALNFFEGVTDNALSGRFESLENDEGSGRLEAWAWTMKHIKSSSFLEVIFGHGWNSVFYQSGVRSAHNDFLEVLYDFGIVIFVVYLLLYKRLFSASIKLLKEGSRFASPLFCSTVILLINSFVSHVVFYPKYLVLYCLFWAYIDSQNITNIKDLNKKGI